jgi:hypothetical protein
VNRPVAGDRLGRLARPFLLALALSAFTTTGAIAGAVDSFSGTILQVIYGLFSSSGLSGF